MCTLTIRSYVLCILMVEGMSVVVNVILSLMSVMSPPPALCNISVRTVVKLCTLGVLDLEVSLVSWIVMMSACVSWISSLSSSSLFLIPFTLTCRMMRFISLLLLGLCPSVGHVVMWSSLVCLWVFRGTLCAWGGCCDCKACTDVCVARVSAEGVWWCEVDGNTGVGDGWGVLSAGHVGGTRSLGMVSSSGWVWCVGCVELVKYVKRVCVWLGAACVERGWVDERIGFGI